MTLDIKSMLIIDGLYRADCLETHGIRITRRYNINQQQLIEEIPLHDGVLVQTTTKVTEEVINACSKLKVVACAGACVNNIDVNAAERRGIMVINTPDTSVISIAEMACCLILALARKVVPAARTMYNGAMDPIMHTGSELCGKTLAIIGLDKVGTAVALRMRAFGLKLIGYDPFVSVNVFLDNWVTKMELDEIWPLADIITIHVPLNEYTQGLINERVLNMCKADVKIVNTGPIQLINKHALLNALESNKVGGVALDMFEEEPPTDDVTKAIIQHKLVIATPRISTLTTDRQYLDEVSATAQVVNLVKPGTCPTPLYKVTNF